MGSNETSGGEAVKWLALVVSAVALGVSSFNSFHISSRDAKNRGLQVLQFVNGARDCLAGSENTTRYGSLTKDSRKLECARRDIEQARLLDPQNPEVFLYDGMYNEAMGNWAAATKACENAKQLLKVQDRFKAVVCLGNILLDQGHLAEAARTLQSGAGQEPVSAVIEANLCLVRSKEGKLAQAAEACSKAVEIDPRSLPALNNFGIVLMQQGDLNGAIKRFNMALGVSPEQADIRANLGLALQYSGGEENENKAVEMFKKALELDPTNSFVKEKLAALYRKKGSELDKIRATVLETGTPRQVEIQ